MGKEEVADFLAKMNEDPSLERGLVVAQAAAIVEYAASQGFEFTVDELAEITEVLLKIGGDELSDDELEEVAGGFGRGNVLRGSLERTLLKSRAAGIVTIVTFGAPTIPSRGGERG